MVQEQHLQVVADRMAGDVLAIQLRSNDLIRWGNSRSGALAMAAVMTGSLIAAVGVYRRMTRHDKADEVAELLADHLAAWRRVLG